MYNHGSIVLGEPCEGSHARPVSVCGVHTLHTAARIIRRIALWVCVHYGGAPTERLALLILTSARLGIINPQTSPHLPF